MRTGEAEAHAGVASRLVAAAKDHAISVMVVDDSAVIRGLITRLLEEQPDITVIASATNGEMAVSQLRRRPDIDVIVLDVEMPVMDGLAALPKLLAAAPDVRIIMASTLTQRNADISLRALEAGAADYVPKPTSRDIATGDTFRAELLRKVRALARRRPRPHGGGDVASRSGGAAVASPSRASVPGAAITLRRPGLAPPEIIAIGSSTGGPNALCQLLGAIKPGSVKQPMLITQHMPATFTPILAEHISRLTGWICVEARDGQPLVPGRILLAPGDYHMLVVRNNGLPGVKLTSDPPENFCRPSVDPMLRSVATVFGGRALVVMLTGMGSDGCGGSKRIVEAGGTVFAQDEATSVVWGMPGAVAAAGLCSRVEPLAMLPSSIIRFAAGDVR